MGFIHIGKNKYGEDLWTHTDDWSDEDYGDYCEAEREYKKLNKLIDDKNYMAKAKLLGIDISAQRAEAQRKIFSILRKYGG